VENSQTLKLSSQNLAEKENKEEKKRRRKRGWRTVRERGIQSGKSEGDTKKVIKPSR